MENDKPQEERLSIGPTLLERMNSSVMRGHEPVRDLFTLDNIKGKTIIKDDYERLLLSKMRFLSDRFLNPKGKENHNTIIIDFIKDYEEYGPAVGGIARMQFVETHKTEPPEILRNPEQQRENRTSGNRRM